MVTRVKDYIPVVSTFVAVCDLHKKRQFTDQKITSLHVVHSENDTRILQESKMRIAVKMIPVLGNLLLFALDIIHKRKNKDVAPINSVNLFNEAAVAETIFVVQSIDTLKKPLQKKLQKGEFTVISGDRGATHYIVEKDRIYRVSTFQDKVVFKNTETNENLEFRSIHEYTKQRKKELGVKSFRFAQIDVVQQTEI